MNRNLLFYIITVTLFGLLVYLVIQQGQLLKDAQLVSQIAGEAVQKKTVFSEMAHNLRQSLSILILQILVIILTAQLFSRLIVKINQPAVMGEIIAGIFLGPSFLGLWFPDIAAFIFPASSFANLHILSQIGLLLFMFIIGMEVDVSVLQQKANNAVVISHTGIAFSYFLGVGLAYFLYAPYAPDNVTFSAFALFMGIAMSITAFPVLARIVQERGMSKTPLALMVITCAATDDVTAWCLLAVVIAAVKASSMTGALITILLAVAYILLMLYGVKPLLQRIAHRSFTRETMSRRVIAAIFGILLTSAYLAEIIGIHALFGAFMAGVIIPQVHEFKQVLAEKIEDLSLVLLLPLFFAFTGLRTQIGLLNDPHLWAICLLVIAVAIVGKFVGSSLAARFVGQSWRDSLVIGALMNTRGLMELVVLNIGYDLGVLSPEIFTMLVLMALITTFMTGPAIDLINSLPCARVREEAAMERPGYHVLISFSSAGAGSRLLQLAGHMGLHGDCQTDITALHLTPGSDVSRGEAELFEKESFQPILDTAAQLGLELKTAYQATDDVKREIVHFANQGPFHFLLLGSTRPMFSENATGGKAKKIFEEVNCSVGLLIDKGFRQIANVLLVVHDPADAFLAGCGAGFLRQPGRRLAVLDCKPPGENDETLRRMRGELPPAPVINAATTPIDAEYLARFDLLLISLSGWHALKKQKTDWLPFSPSVLILRK
jgi:Kef-type K+ transport system membrane component KefB